MFFAVLNPNKTPMGAYETMKDAQDAIAAVEPDVIEQGKYQIHPVSGPADAEMLKLVVVETWKLEKFDGEYLGQEPVEVIEFNS